MRGTLRRAVIIGAALGATACGDEFIEDPETVDGCIAMRFDGDQVVQVPDAADLDPIAPFTIEVRVFYDGTSDEVHLVAHQHYGDQVGYQLGLHNQAIDFRLYRPEGTLWLGGGQVSGGQWHHLAAVSDGEEARLYLDGALVGDQGHLGGHWPTDYAGPLRFGAAAYADQFHLDGLIDEVRISQGTRYVREFDVPAGPFSPDADTIALWHFDEPDGQVVEDSAGQHQGTLGPTAGVEYADPLRESGHCLEAIARPASP